MATTFDQTELLDRVDNDLEFLAETVEMLRSEGRTLLDGVRQAAEAADAQAMAGAAHALKGMIANFCAPDAQRLALEVEQMGRSGELAGSRDAVGRLHAAVEALIDELVRFLGERAS